MDRNVSSRNISPMTSKKLQHKEASQHDELIKFIHEAWHKVSKEAEQGVRGHAVFYSSPAPQPRLPGFKPFDLEGWWGRRLVQNISNRGHP